MGQSCQPVPAPAAGAARCRISARPHPPVPPASSPPCACCSPAAKPRHSVYLLKDLISCIFQLQSSRLGSWKSRKPAAAQAVLHARCWESGSVAPQESQHTQHLPQHSLASPRGHAQLVQGDAQLCRVMPWHQKEATPCLGGSTEPAWGTRVAARAQKGVTTVVPATA